MTHQPSSKLHLLSSTSIGKSLSHKKATTTTCVSKAAIHYTFVVWIVGRRRRHQSHLIIIFFRSEIFLIELFIVQFTISCSQRELSLPVVVARRSLRCCCRKNRTKIGLYNTTRDQENRCCLLTDKQFIYFFCRQLI